MLSVFLLAGLSGAFASEGYAQTIVPICDRTDAVEAEILRAIGGGVTCSTVTSEQLAGFTRLDLEEDSITTLQSGDFAGLTNLQSLDLNDNELGNLPGNVFASLTNLQSLDLSDNELGSLPGNVFAGLTNLQSLDLSRNDLTSLPGNVFASLTNLQSLDLSRSDLTSLPGDVFAGLTNLQQVDLRDNDLRSLPAGLFVGLQNATFQFVTSLTKRNPGVPFPLRLELVRTDNSNRLTSGPAEVKVRLAQGAPWAMTVGLSVTGGTLSANSATIAKGATESRAITVTRMSNVVAVVSLVNPPAVDDDYAAAGSLPATFRITLGNQLTLQGVCDRTGAVETVILSAIGGGVTCGAVTPGQLAGVRNLNLNGQSLTALQSGDFAGLSNLQTLDLQQNRLMSLPGDVFDGLSNLQTLDLQQNHLMSLPGDVFDGLSNLQTLDLQQNRLMSLPGDVFDGLSNLRTLDLQQNRLTSLPGDVFDGLSNLRTLDLQQNRLTSLPGSLLDDTMLTTLDLSSNRISSLDGNAFAGLTTNNVTIQLEDNLLESLPDGVFAGLQNATFQFVTSLTERNPGVPFPLTLELARTDNTDLQAPGPAEVKVRLAEGAPWAMTVDLSVTGGTLSASSAMIPQGATESQAITVTQMPGVIATVRLGDAPAVRNDYAARNGLPATFRTAVGEPLTLFTANVSICDRTDAVEAEILRVIGGGVTCSTVTSEQLAGFRRLDLEEDSIATLQSGDFAGLTNLEELDLDDNGLESLPGDVFNGLTKLKKLEISDNDLGSLPGDVFDRLTNLEELDLNDNDLGSLPGNVFAGLTNLQSLDLSRNDLRSLSGNAFAGLTNLQSLDLSRNDLRSLSGNAFAGLTNLQSLDLLKNDLTSLPGDVFAGLSNLQQVDLRDNELRSLPAGLFVGLQNATFQFVTSSTTSNPGVPFPLRLELVRTDNSNRTQLTSDPAKVKVRLAQGAPWTMTVDLSVVNGTLSANSATIAKGATESEAITVTRMSNVPAVVRLGDAPAVDDDYAAASDLPATFRMTLGNQLTLKGVCDRTDEVEAVILAAIPGTILCSRVTPEQLAGVTTLDLGEDSLTALQAGDFAGLSNLQTLDLQQNHLTSLPEDVFDGLSNLQTLNLQQNRLTSLPEDVFDGLSNLQTLDLQQNHLTSLPEDVFDGLTNLQTLNLQQNRLTSLPGDVFDGLTNLQTLDLQQNHLTSLPEDVFDGLSNLRTLDLQQNRLTSLPGDVFDGLTNLQTLDLQQNHLTSLPEDVFDGLSNLRTLDLQQNRLTGLPGSLLDDTMLTTLDLSSNRISSLDGNAFAGLTTNNVTIQLEDNLLESLPDGVFAGLQNAIFQFVTSLTERNPGVPFPLTLELVRTDNTDLQAPGPAGVKVRLAEGAPWAMTVDLSVMGGTLSASSAMIPQGATESQAITVTQMPGAIATVRLGDAPAVHNDYAARNGLPATFRIAVGEPLTLFTANISICDRTDVVEAEILRAIGGGVTCSTVTLRQLASVGRLDLEEDSLTALQSGDFAGLTNLQTLDLQQNRLTSLPEDMFNGLTNLRYLRLNNNALRSLPGDVFDGLTNLRWLYLNNSALRSLPGDVFDGLTNLRWLYLNNNALRSLPVNVFADLTNLQEVDLQGNELRSLPAGLFAGLENATFRFVTSSTTSNPGVPFPLKLELVRTDNSNRLTSGPAKVKVRLAQGAPWAMTVNLWATGGTLSVSPARIAKGATESQAITVTRMPDVVATVRLGDAPAVHNDYAARNGLPATFQTAVGNPLVLEGICDRTDAVEAEILRAIGGGVTCNAVTPAQLARVTTLDLGEDSITAMQAGDFAGLTNLEELDLNGNDLRSLPADVFNGLTNLGILRLYGNELTSLPADVFNGLTKLHFLWLDSNNLRSLPADMFDGLTKLQRLRLHNNDLTSLPVDVFDGLTNLGTLRLDNNDLTSLPVDVFDGLTNLGSLNLMGNDLTSLPGDVFDGLTNLGSVRLENNELTSLPADVFAGLTNLRNLDLENNDLTSLPADLFNDTNDLRNLWLDHNELTSLPADVFAGLNNLRNLSLGSNDLTSLPANVFVGLIRLHLLWLHGNDLTSLPADVFDPLTKLDDLWLQGNDLTSLPADVFDRLSNLQRLLLQGNGLTSLPADVFDDPTKLEILYLGGNDLTSLPADVFDPLTKLQRLGIDNNDLMSLPANVFDDLTRLQKLDLRNNDIADIAPIVGNTGLGSGDTVDLTGNILNAAAYSTHIPALQGRSVTVKFDPDFAVSIPDTNLRTALESVLNKSAGAPILRTELAGLTTLSANHSSIANLTGLEHATGLTRLDITTNTISDIAPLVANRGLGSDNTVDLTGNTLNAAAYDTHIPALRGRGVTVHVDPRTATRELVTATTTGEDVAISIAALEPSVIEGEPVQFQLTATPAPTNDLMVAIVVADPDSVLLDTAPTEVMIPASQSTFMLELETDDDDIDELDATVTVTLEESPDTRYTVAAAPDNSASITVMDNDGLTRERRERGIEYALGAFGRAAGWDLVEAIRNRSRNTTLQGKAFEISNLPTFGVINMGTPGTSIETSSIDLDRLLLDSEIKIAFNPQVAQASESGSSGKSPLVRAWVNASRTGVESNPFEGRTQEGELTIGRFGIDAAYSGGWLIGSVFSWHDGNIEFDDTDFDTTGEVGIDLLSINPYVSYTKNKLHLWGTIGGGFGDLSYEDSPGGRTTSTGSDLRMLTAAAGAEYEFGQFGPFDLKGRGEGMVVNLDAEDSSHALVGYDDIGVTVYGARGELELGLPLQLDNNRTELRPYVFTGLRQDGGLGNDLVLEYGGGFALSTGSLVAEGTIRSQSSSEDDAVELKGYSISLAYDRGNDRRGLVAGFEQSAGPSSDYDPYGGGALSSFSPGAAGTETRLHLGYGIGWDEQLLRPFVAMDWGEAQESDLDLGLEYQYSDGSASLGYGDGEFNLRFRFQKLF